MQGDARCARVAHLERLDPELCDGSTYTSKHAADVSPATRFRELSLIENYISLSANRTQARRLEPDLPA